jgi:hypothetical protein
MIIPNEAAGDVEEKLDMHTLGELRTLIHWCSTLFIKSMVVGKACCEWRTRAVKAGEQSIGKRGARCFANKAWFR